MVGRSAVSRSFTIVNATLLTLAPLARAQARAAVSHEDLGLVAAGSVVVENGRIAAAGAHRDCIAEHKRVAQRSGFEEIDARGALVMPGFIDAHTHALFAGNRVADFEALAAGQQPKLGMAHTIAQTRKCSTDDLIEIGVRHLGLMAEHGTTTAEVKSGYALTLDGETRMLEAMRALDERDDLPHVVATFCGAHAVPPEAASADAFVEELCERYLPAIAKLKVATFADAFCERGFFDVAQCRRFLGAAARVGLALRLHADELSDTGAAALAAELGCASADHLNHTSQDGVDKLARSGAVAVLCPTTAEYLGLRRPAARALIEHGVPVALATDFNPGTSPCCSLQEAAFFARRQLGLSAPETIAAVTVQAARSLRLQEQVGALFEGRRADIVILSIDNADEFGYYLGTNIVGRAFVGV